MWRDGARVNRFMRLSKQGEEGRWCSHTNKSTVCCARPDPTLRGRQARRQTDRHTDKRGKSLTDAGLIGECANVLVGKYVIVLCFSYDFQILKDTVFKKAISNRIVRGKSRILRFSSCEERRSGLKFFVKDFRAKSQHGREGLVEFHYISNSVTLLTQVSY